MEELSGSVAVAPGVSSMTGRIEQTDTVLSPGPSVQSQNFSRRTWRDATKRLKSLTGLAGTGQVLVGGDVGS
jgi:hypothetical protein